MKTWLLAAVAALLCLPAFGQAPAGLAQQAMQKIQGSAIRGHMRFLADSLLEGRAPGTRGYDIAARYVESQLEGMGLQPAGLNGSWYQNVPLRKSVVDAAKSSLTLHVDGKEVALTEGKDYVFSPHMLESDSVADAPVVFVGFGVTAADQNYDDYSGVDVKGKIVATLYGAPSKFESTERAYYSDSQVKQQNAVAHGAIGIIGLMLPEEWKRYSWEWIRPQIEAGDMKWLNDKGVPHDTFRELKAGALFNNDAGAKLFIGAKHNLQEVSEKARKGEPQSFPLAVTAQMHVVSQISSLESPNILAVQRGSDPTLKHEYVIYTAHLDHLGICPPVNGDNVCHGALDNASGSATLLEVARAFAAMPKGPRRSIMFVFVTGEEMGLLGSDYFAVNPTVPRKSIAANVNIDEAPGMYYAMKDVVAMGPEHSNLQKVVESATHELGYTISPDPMPEEVGFIRSDQYSFVLQGVPAVYIADGVKAEDPKIDGLNVLRKWLTTRYHTPADNMDQPIDYESGAKGAQLNFLIGYQIAEQAARPEWNAGDFFGKTFGGKQRAATPTAE